MRPATRRSSRPRPGNDGAADCSILKQIENDVTSPADAARITEVLIYRADQNGAVLNGQQNVYTRTGSTSCTLPDSTVLTVPYTASSISYPTTDRCNILLGTAAAVTRDTRRSTPSA